MKEKNKKSKKADVTAIQVLTKTNEKINHLVEITGLKKYKVTEIAVDMLYEAEMNKRRNLLKR